MVHLHLGACYVAVLLAQVRDFRAFGRRWLNEVGVHLVLRAVHAAAQADVLPSRLRVADTRRVILIPIGRIRVLVRRRELERWVEVPGEVVHVASVHGEAEPGIHGSRGCDRRCARRCGGGAAVRVVGRTGNLNVMEDKLARAHKPGDVASRFDPAVDEVRHEAEAPRNVRGENADDVLARLQVPLVDRHGVLAVHAEFALVLGVPVDGDRALRVEVQPERARVDRA